MKKETRHSLKKKTLNRMETALDYHQSIPLSEGTYVEGVGDIVNRTITKEGNDYFVYKMENGSSGDYRVKKISKAEALLTIEKHLNTFNKQQLQEELDYWTECLNFLKEENLTFINAYVEQKSVSMLN